MFIIKTNMENLLSAANYVDLPRSDKPKIIDLCVVIKLIKCCNTIMSIIPSLNDELYKVIQIIKQTNTWGKLKYIQKGQEILSKIRIFRPKLRSLSRKVRKIPKLQFEQIKRLLYSDWIEQETMSYYHEQLNRVHELYNEFKQLIK